MKKTYALLVARSHPYRSAQWRANDDAPANAGSEDRAVVGVCIAVAAIAFVLDPSPVAGTLFASVIYAAVRPRFSVAKSTR